MTLNSYLYETAAYVRDYPTTPHALAASLLCKLSPTQLVEKIKSSGISGRKFINTFYSSYTPKGRPSNQWLEYFGLLMAEVFRASEYSNYQLLINALQKSRHKDIGSFLKICSIPLESEYSFVNDLEPRFIYLIDEFIRREKTVNWHEFWTNTVYEEKKSQPNNERFAEFKTLGNDFGFAQGLEICPTQSFGFEIEITTNRTYKIPDFKSQVWLDGAMQIIKMLNDAVGMDLVSQKPFGYHENNNYSLWRVEHDLSVGWEIVSPVLVGAEGAKEAKNVFEELRFLISEHDFFTVDYRCGLHLSIQTHITTNEEWRSFIKRYIKVEPGLLPLVSPSRVFEYKKTMHTYNTSRQNAYCNPISFQKSSIEQILNMDIEAKDINSDKYKAVNFKRIKGINLLEVRLHNGTFSYLAALSWLALWMRIINYFESNDIIEPLNLDCHNFRSCTDENVVDILKALDAKAGQKLNSKLVKELTTRRRKMRSNWELAFPEKVRSWEKAGFYETEP